MNRNQTKEITQRVCSVEGRTWTTEMSVAWHSLLEHLDFEVAYRACTLALQDHNIHQVGPKHLLSKTQAAIAELNALLRENNMNESEWESEPEPVCKAHDLGITKCKDCIDVLVHQVGHLRGDELHRWACQHLYRKDSLVGQEAPF